jgi:2-iminobutanoate/2-iminopropanoate deaminase
MNRDVINPAGLAAPLGPYSYGVKTTGGQLLFISGCVALDGLGNIVGKGDVAAQTDQIMRNLQAVIETAGGTMRDVVKITNYMLDIGEFPKVAPVRMRYLAEPFPASTTVQVSKLIRDEFLIEVEAIAVIRMPS